MYLRVIMTMVNAFKDLLNAQMVIIKLEISVSSVQEIVADALAKTFAQLACKQEINYCIKAYVMIHALQEQYKMD